MMSTEDERRYQPSRSAWTAGCSASAAEAQLKLLLIWGSGSWAAWSDAHQPGEHTVAVSGLWRTGYVNKMHARP